MSKVHGAFGGASTEGDKAVNRGMFLFSVALTGAMVGASVWAVFYVMDLGIGPV